ncbi:MAG: hypothetical protein LBK04_01775 [Clostridiales Family XIII bacterium]|nr:hypothetical protein [Clostridiales Family XIII bacterium]
MKTSKMSIRGGRTLRGPAALLLALILALGSFTAVFAAEPPTDPPVYKPPAGTSSSPAAAAITKILRMPVGTDTPAHTYTFTITGGSREGGGTSGPAINNITAAFTSADTGTAGTGAESDVKTVKKQTANITWPNFTGTGIYTYTVKESGSISGGTLDSATEKLTYSLAEYTLKVYVAYDKDSKAYFVQYAAVSKSKNDGGTEIGGDWDDGKVNAEPGNGSSTYSALAFTNTYIKTTNNPDPENNEATGALYFDEAIDGNMSDPDQAFTVSVTITIPSLVTETSYKAWLVDATSVVTVPGTEYDSGEGNNYYTFESGTAKAVAIRPGQRLIFANLPVGTSYAASQTAPANYVLNAAVTYGSNEPVSSENTVSANTVSTSGSDFDSVAKRVGNSSSAVSNVVFTNKYDISAPTGIAMDNLPYILLILLALTALAAYVAGRLRRKGFEAR